MKLKITTIFLLFLSLVLNSCSDTNSNNNDPIIGKWQYVSHSIDGVNYVDRNCKPSTLQFNSNGNEIRTEYVSNRNLTMCRGIQNNYKWVNAGAFYHYTSVEPYGYNNGFRAVFENNYSTLTTVFEFFNQAGNYQVNKFVYKRIY